MLGPHIINSVRPYFEQLKKWQPRSILVLDPNRDEMRDLRQICPDTVIIGRWYFPDSEVDNRIKSNSIEAARYYHDITVKRIIPDVDYWQIANEVCQHADTVELLAEFETERMRLAGSLYKCATFGFGVGNPDLPEHDRMALWRKIYGALDYAEEFGHILCLHQYGKGDLWGPYDESGNLAPWFINRFEAQVLPNLPQKKLKIAVTEYGVDNLIWGDRPSGYKDTQDSIRYVNDLIKMSKWLEQFSNRIIGYNIFTLGHNNPWQTYDINGVVLERLAEHFSIHKVSKPPTTVEPKKEPSVKQNTATLIKPIDGFITSRYGPRNGSSHKGIDIAAPLGTKIKCIADGTVEMIGTHTAYGNYIRVYHEKLNTHSFYAHMSEWADNISIGDVVSSGKTIGYCGSTGNSTGPHLHLEIRIGTKTTYSKSHSLYSKGQIDPEVFYMLHGVKLG